MANTSAAIIRRKEMIHEDIMNFLMQVVTLQIAKQFARKVKKLTKNIKIIRLIMKYNCLSYQELIKK